MKAEELVIGNKYVPIKKSIGQPFMKEDGAWYKAVGKGQNFLYYLGPTNGGKKHVFSHEQPFSLGGRKIGEWYNPEDVVEYPIIHSYKPDRAFLKEIWSISTDEEKKELESKFPHLMLNYLI